LLLLLLLLLLLDIHVHHMTPVLGASSLYVSSLSWWLCLSELIVMLFSFFLLQWHSGKDSHLLLQQWKWRAKYWLSSFASVKTTMMKEWFYICLIMISILLFLSLN
jgi:hypothetical protein